MEGPDVDSSLVTVTCYQCIAVTYDVSPSHLRMFSGFGDFGFLFIASITYVIFIFPISPCASLMIGTLI